jgi:pimeloyl-ACP methyl ester carboxylesterase
VKLLEDLFRRLALPGLLAAVAAGASAATLSPCRLEGLGHEAQCGVVRRPLDPAHPQGVQIDVHYAVIPAVARNKKADPVFLFAGGPGQSAIDLAGSIGAAFERFSNRRDIVLVDQRGTGRSAPLKCSDQPSALPLSDQIDPAKQLQQLQGCEARLQKLPYGDLRFFTTTIAMQDFDAVRAALGAERIDAIGASYGTRAVLEYLRQFPQHVRRAVIDGVAPPDMVLPASFSTDNQAALDALFDACERDAACTRQYPQLRARWQQLLAGLPKAVTLTHPLTGRAETVTLTRAAVLSMVRTPLYMPVLASGLPYALTQAADGRFEPLAALAGAMAGRGGSMSLAEGMHFSVVCSEDAPRLAQASDTPGRDFGDSFGSLYRQVCAQWPKGEVPAAFYTIPPAPVATLVISGAIDPATPPRHGARVAQALGAKARHVVLSNSGHGGLQQPCVRELIFHFVDAETDAQALAVPDSCPTLMPRPPAFVPVQPPAQPASGAPLPPMRSTAFQETAR